MNTSLSKQKLEALAARRAELSPYLVPGWTLTVELRFQADPTVRGYEVRGQTVLFRCVRPDCRRRLEVDLHGACRSGLGHLKPAELRANFACLHYAGCRLAYEEAWPQGEPLISLWARGGVAVQVRCETCLLVSVVTPRALIDRLKASRRGDGSTGIGRLGRALRGPCRACKGRRFTAKVVEAAP